MSDSVGSDVPTPALEVFAICMYTVKPGKFKIQGTRRKFF
jgi:hypothetical protein